MAKPDAAPVVLTGHQGEVTGVAWCPSDFGQIVTCGDDARLCVWSIDRNARKAALSPQRAAVRFFV